MMSEYLEIVEMVGDHGGNAVEVNIEVTVHEYVSETRDAAKSRGEFRRQHVGLDQAVDRRAVGRRVEAGGRAEVARDVEGVLRTELETALDDPAAVGVGTKGLRRYARMPPQSGERLAQRYQVAVHDAVVYAAGSHDRSLPSAYRRAASILSSCGRKSK